MLAAGSAWRILEAEHSRLRQLLAAITSVLEGGAWTRRVRWEPASAADQNSRVSKQTPRPKGSSCWTPCEAGCGSRPVARRARREGRKCERSWPRRSSCSGPSSRAATPRRTVASLLLQHRELMVGCWTGKTRSCLLHSTIAHIRMVCRGVVDLRHGRVKKGPPGADRGIGTLGSRARMGYRSLQVRFAHCRATTPGIGT
jgi:hypothetical protein